MNTNQQKVVKYFTNPETKLGFNYVLWGSKHFGFYPTGKADITEKEAQILYQDLDCFRCWLRSRHCINLFGKKNWIKCFWYYSCSI